MWMKKLRQRKLQSVLIFVIVFVCSILMTSSMVIMTSLHEPYQELIKECNSPEVKIYPMAMSEEELEQVKVRFEALDSCEWADTVRYHYLTEKLYVKDVVLDGFFDLSEYKEPIHGQYRVISGEMKKPGDGECIIPSVLANSRDIQIGELLLISGMDGDLVYKVIAVYTEPYNMSQASDNEILVGTIPKGLPVKQYLSVYGSNNAGGSDIISEYREKNNGVLEGRGETLEARVSNNSITENILGGILFGISLLILVVSGIMIRYMIRNALLCDKKTVAIYKTIGYSNSELTGIYLKLYLFIVATGSITGAAASVLISDSFIVQTFRNMGNVKTNGTLLPGLFCIVVIMSFVLFQVYGVLSKLKDMKPVVIFSGKEAELGKKRQKRYMFSEKFNFSPLGIGVRMLQRDKKNTAYIILTCVVSIYCINFALSCLTIVSSMIEKNYYWIGFDKHDVSVTSLSVDRFLPVVNQLKEEPETARVILTLDGIKIMLPWKKGMGEPIIPSMVYESYEEIDMPLLEGRNPRYSNEIVISSLIADELHKKIGDYMEVNLAVDKKVSLLVTGIYQSYYNMGRGCRLLGSTLEENGVDFKYEEASVYLKPGTDIDKYVSLYGIKYRDSLDIIKRTDKYSTIMSTITEPQIKAITPFMILSLLLGALNITAIIYLKNNDNRKVNSIYQCIGYSSHHLMKANLYFTGIVAVITMAITIPLFLISFPQVMILSLFFFGFKKYLVDLSLPAMLAGNFTILMVFLGSTLLSSITLKGSHINELNQE